MAEFEQRRSERSDVSLETKRSGRPDWLTGRPDAVLGLRVRRPRVARASPDPADKADMYAKLKLTLIYQPEERHVQSTVKPGLNMPK